MAKDKRKSTKDKRKSTKDGITDEMMARFDHAYGEALERFTVFQRLQNAYDNNPSTVNWPTISEITFPITFNSVEEQLPFSMRYLFPENRFIQLLPNKVMDEKSVRSVEDSLLYTVRSQIDLENAAFPSIKDSWKFGVGYGLIDTERITPPKVIQSRVQKDGAILKQTPNIVFGRPVTVPVYKYLSVIQVIPMPGGANVEGANKASGHFVIDFKTESEFRDMMDEKDPLTNDKVYKGDVDTIVKEARSMNFDARAIMSDNIWILAGKRLSSTNTNDKRIPVLIPIVRCYFDHEQHWIANGKHRIWSAKDTYQTYMSDLVKWSACADGSRWFPQNVTEASERTATGQNIWYNGLVDLAMYMMNPTRIINTTAVDNPDSLGRGPGSDIRVNRNIGESVQYMDLPQFPQPLFGIGDIIEKFHAQTNSQVSSVRNGQAGLVRGGANALETMLSSTTGRQFLASKILKLGGLKPTIEKILIKKQLLIDDDGDKFIDVDFDADTGDRKFVEKSVTIQDMRNVYKVDLNLPAARLNSASDFAERAAYFDRTERKPELFDDRARYEELTGDVGLVRRTMLPENVVKERAARRAEAEVRNIENGGSQSGTGEAQQTQGQQALAGSAGISGSQ